LRKNPSTGFAEHPKLAVEIQRTCSARLRETEAAIAHFPLDRVIAVEVGLLTPGNADHEARQCDIVHTIHVSHPTKDADFARAHPIWCSPLSG
jgi:hypothetical protein